MAIPDFQAVMLPVLEAVADGRDHLVRDVTLWITDRFGLTEDERHQHLGLLGRRSRLHPHG